MCRLPQHYQPQPPLRAMGRIKPILRADLCHVSSLQELAPDVTKRPCYHLSRNMQAAVLTPRVQKVIMVNDVARAFFEAPMKRTVCVELPEEALTEEERSTGKRVVGVLQMSLYGTRDAAANFQAEVGKF